MDGEAQPSSDTTTSNGAARPKKKRPIVNRSSKKEKRDFVAIRVTAETASKVNKLAAKMQLASGDKTIAGDAVAAAVEKALR